MKKSPIVTPKGNTDPVPLPGIYELIQTGVAVFQAVWLSIQALIIMRRWYDPFWFTKGEGIWLECDNALELNRYIEAPGFQKEFSSRKKKNANVVKVSGILFRWMPLFAGTWGNVEEEWVKIQEYLRGQEPPKDLSSAIREWYTVSLRQWGFSSEAPVPPENGSRYLGFATSDEISATPARVRGEIWHAFEKVVFEEALVKDVTLEVRIEESEFKPQPFTYQNYIVSQPAPSYELQIDSIDQIKDRQPTRFFSAYVWQLVKSGRDEGFAIWEHCNVANKELFEHFKNRLSKRVKELAGRDAQLGENSYSL